MFCNNCGKEIADGLKFCTLCGVNTEPGEVEAEPIPTAYSASAQSGSIYTQPPLSHDPNHQNRMRRKRNSQAMTVLVSSVLIAVILCSWFNVTITGEALSDALKSQAAYVEMDDVTLTGTTFFVAEYMGQINRTFNKIVDGLNRQGYYSDVQVYRLKDFTSSLRIASFVFNLLKWLLVLAVLALPAGMFMILSGKVKGALTVQIGSAVTLFAAIVFVFVLLYANSNIAELLKGIDVELYGSSVKISAGIWLYLAMILSAFNLIFVAVRKSALREFED